MDELPSQLIYWLITTVLAGVLGMLGYWIKRQREKDDKRFEAIEREARESQHRYNDFVSNMPIQYTLRDEFLRVTTTQNGKLDKMTDMLSNLTASMAAVRAATARKGESANGDK